MSFIEPENEIQPTPTRDRCYGCYRPVNDCFCDLIPRIDNRTNVLILQHTRERFHAFNTARIVNRSLQNSRLVNGFSSDFNACELNLSSQAALLYPTDDAMLVSDLAVADRPDEIVILDGTWHHAKTMLRDNPSLRKLPRIRLIPHQPSQYRIRREPNAEAISTVEATVELLRDLEPETIGFDELLAAFTTMIDRQLVHPECHEPRHHERRRRTGNASNTPSALLGDLTRIVVAFGEAGPGYRGRKRVRRPPLHWVAQRLGLNEVFTATIQPTIPLSPELLNHMELAAGDFADAECVAEFRQRWQSFLNGDDTLVVHSKATLDLLYNSAPPPHVILKCVDFQPTGRKGGLDERLLAAGVTPEAPLSGGRAGRRLANAVALVHHLREISQR